jgi:hypothetical protein
MAQGTEDVFSFSAFDPTELGERFRNIEGKGASQSGEAYARMKVATEEATIALESTVEQTRSMQFTARKLAEDVSRPGRQVDDKAMANVRTA